MSSESLAEYRLCAFVTAMVYVLNTRSGIAVGWAREKYKVPVPLTKGPVEFERAFRAHCNNAEQYPQFLACMWVFAVFVNATIAGILGMFWIVMRHLYVTEYHKGGDNITRYTIPAYLCMSIWSLGIVLSIVYGFVRDLMK